jgi:hypothetical protein
VARGEEALCDAVGAGFRLRALSLPGGLIVKTKVSNTLH